MALRTVVTRGFGNGTFNGTIAEVVLRGYATAPDLSIGGVYNISGIFPTGSSVSVSLYDPITLLPVTVTEAACTELNSTGVFIWGANNLALQPDHYQEYLWVMTDGSTTSTGILQINAFTVTAQDKIDIAEDALIQSIIANEINGT